MTSNNNEHVGASNTPREPVDKKNTFWKMMDKIGKASQKIEEKAVAAVFGVSGKMAKGFMKVARVSGKSVARWVLVAAVLTGFAKKETQPAADHEPPKATLTVGTLGMKVFKAEIKNGDKSTDFEANMVGAQTAKELVGKVMPEEEQDKLFEANPIEKIRQKSNADLLQEGSTPVQDTPADEKESGLPWKAAVAVAGVAALAAAATEKSKAKKKDGNDPQTPISVARMAQARGKGPANRS
jgi:hypothetical protein